MQNRNGARSVALVFAINLFAMIGMACTANAQEAGRPNMAAAVRAGKAAFARYYAWLDAPWSADPGTTYVDIERRIDRQKASGQNPDDIFNFYKTQVARKPSDPTAIFEYVYSAYVLGASCSGAEWEDRSKARGYIVEDVGFNAQQLPHSYSFVRLAILALPFSLKDVPIARHLLAVNPNDADVQYALATEMNGTQNLSALAVAYKYAQDLAKARPDDVRSFNALAHIDWHTAWLTHDSSIADRCMAEFQHCADMSPAGSEERRDYEMQVDGMKRIKAKWADNSQGAGQTSSRNSP